MYIQEFIGKYCRDLLQTNKMERSMYDIGDELEYDHIVYDIDNKPIRVIQIDNLEVPVMDIILMDKESFLHCYKAPHAEVIYDNYLQSLSFLHGEEALAYLRNKIKEETDKLNKECEMIRTWSDLNS